MARQPEPLYVLRGHKSAVQCVAFLPNCRALAAGDAEGELKLWDLDSQRATASIRAHESHSGILQVACPSSRPYVVSQGRDGVVKCWQVHSGSALNSLPVQQFASGSYNFCRLALLEPGQTSSSCSISSLPEAFTVTVEQQGSLAEIILEGFPAAPIQHSSTSHDVRSSTSLTRKHSTEEGLLSRQLRHQHQHQHQQLPSAQQQLEANLQSLSLDAGAPSTGSGGVDSSGDSSGLSACYADGADLTEEDEQQLMLRASSSSLVNLGTAGPSNTSSTGIEAAATAASVSASASAAATGAATEAATEGVSGPCYLALPAEDPANVGIWSLGGSGSSTTAAGASSNGGAGGSVAAGPVSAPLMLLKQQQQQQSRDKPKHGLCMAVTLLQPQGYPLHVLTGYEDGSVALWDSRNTSSYVAAQKLHSESTMCLAVSSDCRRGFSGSADDQLASFDLDIAKGHLVVGPQLRLPKAGLADVAIRPDGRIAATAGWDGKVRVWHCRKRQPLALLRWHSQQVACVAFSSDSQLLAAGARDNHISLSSIYPP